MFIGTPCTKMPKVTKLNYHEKAKNQTDLEIDPSAVIFYIKNQFSFELN